MPSTARRAPGARHFRGVLVACLLTLAALTACSSTDVTVTSSPASDASGGPEGVTTYPMTLKTEWGETTLDKAPERIAAISLTSEDMDALLALGITPVYVVDAMSSAPWLTSEQSAAMKTVATAPDFELKAEDVAAAAPDLIIAVNALNDEVDQKVYDRLAQIAPVLAYDGTVETYGIPWQNTLTVIGEAVDRQQAAAELITTVEKTITDTAAAHPEFVDATASFVVNYGKQYGIAFYSGPGSNTAKVLSELGFQPNPNAAKLAKADSISDELLPLVDTDIVFAGENGEESEALSHNKLFTSLQVYQDGGYIPFVFEEDTNWVPWGLRSASALNLPWLVNALSEPAAKALAD